MTRSIGGRLDYQAMARLNFDRLDHAAKVSAIRRLASSGQSASTIASATGLSAEMIENILRGSPGNNAGSERAT